MPFQEVIKRLNIYAEIISFQDSVKTTKESVAALGISSEQIVKSILLILDESKTLLCILRGCDKIDFKKLRNIYKIKNIRTATPEEVLQYTGYPVGAVPPFSEDLDTIADQKIAKYADVYGGGGSINSLVKTSPTEIIKFAKLDDFSTKP